MEFHGEGADALFTDRSGRWGSHSGEGLDRPGGVSKESSWGCCLCKGSNFGGLWEEYWRRGELELELVNGSMRRKKKEAGRGREGKYPGRRLRDKDESGQRRGWPARGHDALAGEDARRADAKMRA